MNFEIKNKELVKINANIFQITKRYGLLRKTLNRIPSIEGMREVLENFEIIKKQLKDVKNANEYEKIVIENLLERIASERAYIKYMFGEMKIDEAVQNIFGKRAVEIIREYSANFNYKEYWKFMTLYEESAHKFLNSEEEHFRERFKKILLELKKDLLTYGKEKFGLPKDYEFELILGQPYRSETYFHPTNRLMVISPQKFLVYREGNEDVVNVTEVIEVLFHEIIGHGRHEINSKGLPLCLEDNSINLANITAHVHAEGVSQTAEKEAIHFMKKFKEKYKIKEEFITQRIQAQKIKTFSAKKLYHYLKLKKKEESKLDVEKEFLKVVHDSDKISSKYKTDSQKLQT